MSTLAPPATMPRTSAALVLGTATVCTGLLAGLYYSYSCSVMPGLGRVDDPAFVATMTNINEAILNPVFFLSFAGGPVATLAALVLARRGGEPRPARRWIAAALGLHAVGFLCTVAVNVPLNDDLARTGDRDAFEGTWVAFNALRAVATTGALACLVGGLLRRG